MGGIVGVVDGGEYGVANRAVVGGGVGGGLRGEHWEELGVGREELGHDGWRVG